MLTPVPYKKWYQSKILWAAVVTMLVGCVPLAYEFLKVVMPTYLVLISAATTLVSGLLTLVWRVFFTNQVLS
jgi:hypothetical protein